MVEKNGSPYDHLGTRCPALGHPVPFSYCMRPASDLPCRRIMDCWHERIDIAAYLEETLTPQQMQDLVRPAPHKISQLLDIVAKVRKTGDPT
mgnify:FL=1